MSYDKTRAFTRAGFAAAFLVFATAFATCAADVSDWRADGTGRYPSATPPTAWSQTENVLWRTPMPAVGNATPVVSGGRVFVCAEPTTLLCVDAETGAILWQRSNSFEDIAPAEADRIRTDQARAQELGKSLWTLFGEIKQLKVALQDSPEDADLLAKLATAEQQAGAVNTELEPLRAAWYSLPATHETNGYSSATPVTNGERVYVVFGGPE